MTSLPSGGGRSTTGLDENLAGALTYVLGFITGVLFLVMETDSAYVRFHARQSTITFAAVLVFDLMLLALPLIGRMLIPVFTVGVAVLWAVLMFKALTGHRYKLPYIGDMADRMNG